MASPAPITTPCSTAPFYSTVLTAAQIAQNVNYVAGVLAGRGITLGNTISSSLNQIIFDGDSITAGKQSTGHGNYPSATMAALSGTYAWSNLGVGSQYVSTIVTNGPTNVDTLWSNYSGSKKIYILFASTNDLANGFSGSSCYTAIKTRCNAAKAAGATKCIVATTLNRGTFSAGQGSATGADSGQQNALNAALRVDFGTQISGKVYSGSPGYADVLMDLQAETNLQNTSNTTYFNSDTIHPNNTGYAIIAADAVIALNYLGIT